MNEIPHDVSVVRKDGRDVAGDREGDFVEMMGDDAVEEECSEEGRCWCDRLRQKSAARSERRERRD